jgi:hypothetical protein
MALLKLNIPAVEMNVQQFEDFIKLRGVRLGWEKAAMCPCVRADATSGTPSFNCGECYNGNRYIDREEIIGAVTNISGQRNAQVFGDLAVGGVYVTVSGQHRLGLNDRITMLDQTARYAEMCELPISRMRLPANPGDTTLAVEHTRRFPTPVSAPVTVLIGGQRIRYTGKTVNTLTGVPTSGLGAITAPIATSDEVRLVEYMTRYAPTKIYDARTQDAQGVQWEMHEGEDFEAVDGRRIRLLTEELVTRFTILYESRPVYLVDQMPHDYRDQRLRLGLPQDTLGRFPVAAILRKDFINRVG